jgi:very-short-patch-repair endonuclease
MENCNEVLVAIINSHKDFLIASEDHWYRIPVDSQQKWLKQCWPPRWVAFYQTKVFGEEAYSIRYYAKVKGIQLAYRWQLFPDDSQDRKANKRYHQVWLEPLERLPQPILSRRRRRIIFIPTTWLKFKTAVEINDLYHESSLEDRLWAELKRLEIQAERQELVEVQKRSYFLDFAVYCAKGKLDLETDGDQYHANPEKSAIDNVRNNDLGSQGWQVLRFTTEQIQNEMVEYCVPKIVATINYLGGVEDVGKLVARKIDLDAPGGTYQRSLFE